VPATQRAVQLTDAYRARLLTIRQQAVAASVTRWQQISARDLNGTFEQWSTTAALVLERAQALGAGFSGAYLAGYVSAELGRPTSTQPVDTARYAGSDSSGQPLVKAFAGALITTKIALAQGRNEAEALRMGRNRAVRVVATESLAAPRAALHDLMTLDEQIKGWRRVTAAGACGACLASATGAVERKGDVLRNHRFCRCQAEPVVDGVRETIHRPTGRETFDALTPTEQDLLLGSEKASLIRSGAVPFDALIASVPMLHEHDGITESPLAALT
jgi:hypothetical protein